MVGGLTGIIAGFVITFLILILVQATKEAEAKKKRNYRIHFTYVNDVSKEIKQDTAVIIGAESEEEAINMLIDYVSRRREDEDGQFLSYSMKKYEITDFAYAKIITTERKGIMDSHI
jgi:hypothetical protein